MLRSGGIVRLIAAKSVEAVRPCPRAGRAPGGRGLTASYFLPSIYYMVDLGNTVRMIDIESGWSSIMMKCGPTSNGFDGNSTTVEPIIGCKQ